MKKNIGIIMVAHGSKRAHSNEEFIELVQKVRLKNAINFNDVQYAFLELAHPSIATTIEKMCTQNMDEIYIYPYFLNSGKHVVVDIPNIVSTMQENCKNIKIKIIKHFGESENIPSIISNDLKSIL